MILTQQIVKDLWAYMTVKYRTRVVVKTDAAEMKLLAEFLSKLKILDKDTFMTRFATTIGHVIYLPADQEKQSLEDQIALCAHEHQHVVQLDRDPISFPFDYLTDTTSRAVHEAEAYRVSMTIQQYLTGKCPTPNEYAQLLRAYAITDQDVDFAREYLRLSMSTIKAGGIPDESAKVVIAWLKEYDAKETL